MSSSESDDEYESDFESDLSTTSNATSNDEYLTDFETDLSTKSDTEFSIRSETDLLTPSETVLANASNTAFPVLSDRQLESLYEACALIQFPRFQNSQAVQNGNYMPSHLKLSNSIASNSIPSNFQPSNYMPSNLIPPKPRSCIFRPKISPFLKLPEHIRIKIFMYVPTRDRVLLQMVCRLFRFEIRVRCGVVGYINEATSWGLTFLRDIICDTVVVGRYQQPQMTPIQLIFRSKLVKHLLFKGPISIQYMDAFIARCCHLSQLSVFCSVVERSPIPNNPVMRREYKAWRNPELIKRFPRRLTTCRSLEICPKGRMPDSTVEYVLELCNYPMLQRVAIKVLNSLRIDEVRRIHMAVFDLLIKCPMLKDVIITTRPIRHDLRYQPRMTLLRPERIIIQVSRTVQLRQLSLTEELVDFHTWGSFMSHQRHLEVLQVLHLCYYPSIFHVMRKNLSSLTKIGIHPILQFEESYIKHNMFLDLSLFVDCPNLKELFIYVGGPFVPGETDVTNFRKLPKTLEILGLQNATFNLEDFMNVIKLPRLRSLGAITFAGTGLETHNMTGDVLMKILQNRSLDELLLQGFTLNVHGVEEVFLVGKMTHSLSNAQPNTFHLRNKTNPSSNRWIVGSKKDEYLFRLFDSRIFES